MDKATDKLLSFANASISAPEDDRKVFEVWGRLGLELAELLQRKNGFYAYESALLVRPSRNMGAPLGLCEWNAPALWGGSYARKIDALFFAEDIFGVQFCIHDDAVSTFDPETGAFDELGQSIAEWTREVIENRDLRTGYPLAHEWQARNGALAPGERLLPKSPFVLGGKYEVENLCRSNDIKGMLFRASIANQIQNLPDGSQVILRVSGRGQP